MLASGFIDLVIEANLQPYDIVALIPIVEGAGGVITTWDGGPAQAGGRIVAAGDPRVHAAALAHPAGRSERRDWQPLSRALASVGAGHEGVEGGEEAVAQIVALLHDLVQRARQRHRFGGAELGDEVARPPARRRRGPRRRARPASGCANPRRSAASREPVHQP